MTVTTDNEEGLAALWLAAGLAWLGLPPGLFRLSLVSFPTAAVCCSCSSSRISIVACKGWRRGQVSQPQKGPWPPAGLPTTCFYEACVPVSACKRSTDRAFGLHLVYSLTQLKGTLIQGALVLRPGTGNTAKAELRGRCRKFLSFFGFL